MERRIDDAILAHVNWVARFSNVISGIDREAIDPARAGDPRACEFGQWLRDQAADLMDAGVLERIHALHDQFHETAGSLAGLLHKSAYRDSGAQVQRLEALSGELLDALYAVRDGLSRADTLK